MSLLEGNACLGKPFKIWRLRLRMTAKPFHIVIEIITHYQDDIGLWLLLGDNRIIHPELNDTQDYEQQG